MIACSCGRKFQHYRFPIHCACGEKIQGPNGRVAGSHWVPLHQYAIDHANNWDADHAKVWFSDWCKRIPGSCDCESKWAKYCESNPPRFSNPDEFFAWGVEAHNYVSTNHVSPPKLPMTVFEAEGKYRASWAKRKPRAIITLAVDDHLPVLEITRLRMKDYADRVHADFIEITDNLHPEWPMDNKWRVRNYAWHYDRALFLDSDVVVMPNAPNIFELETAPICVRDETADYAGREGWNDQELADMFASQGIAKTTLQRFPNGGVILFDSNTSQLYSEPPLPCPRTWCLDQHWLQHQIESTGTEVSWLDDRWNWPFIRPDFFRGISNAWFVHLNGSRGIDYRIELAKRIVSGNFDYFARRTI